MNGQWLRTLIAVIDEGSFEAAADELRVTPSAVSQRIKALEAHLGRMVVRRTLPCTPTPAGESLLRMARQVTFLEDETLAELDHDSGAGRLRVAVNADSLATWFRPVLGDAATWPETTLWLDVEDQAHSAHMLRRGDVIAAVTSDPVPVAGCRIEPLGVMRYLPVAAPALVERWPGADGQPDWARMPALRYNAKDDLQLDFLRRRGVESAAQQPQVPGSEAFLAGVVAGLGWGLIPEAQLGSSLEEGALQRLADDVVDVPLFWQVWNLDSIRIARLGDAVRRAADALR